MDSAIASENGPQTMNCASATSAIAVRTGRDREAILMWCISTVFAFGMLALLAAMCVAEISIHRRSSDAAASGPHQIGVHDVADQEQNVAQR